MGVIDFEHKTGKESKMSTEREITEKMIEDGKVMIAEAETKLAELDEPALLHGDYGIDPGNQNKPFFYNKPKRSSAGFSDKKGGVEYSNGDFNSHHYISKRAIIFGNIFDDLERNSKDLKEFNRRDLGRKRGNKLTVYIDDNNEVCLDTNDNCIIFEDREVIVFHQKLGQLIATAKRKVK